MVSDKRKVIGSEWGKEEVLKRVAYGVPGIPGKGDDPLPAEESWLATEDRSGYAEFLRAEDEEMETGIRRATRTGRPFGSEQFIDQMEFSLNQRLRPGTPGRPRKIGKCPG